LKNAKRDASAIFAAFEPDSQRGAGNQAELKRTLASTARLLSH
jgi:hypothetical protein